MVPAGKKEFEITILEPSEPSQLGEAEITYSQVACVWGERRPLYVKKIAEFRQAGFKASEEVRIDYLSWLTPAHRLSIGGQQFAIETMTNEQFCDETWILTVVRNETGQ